MFFGFLSSGEFVAGILLQSVHFWIFRDSLKINLLGLFTIIR